MDTKTQKQQDSIRRLIQRQYDQLLDLCEQTRAEVDMLSSSLYGGSMQNSTEISKVQDMISLMEKDIHKKKEETAKQSIENKYDQLLNFYNQTKDEITVLEGALNQGLPSMDLRMQQNSIIGHNAFDRSSFYNTFQDLEDLNPRERLNLHPHDPFAEMVRSQAPQQPLLQPVQNVVPVPPEPYTPPEPVVPQAPNVVPMPPIPPVVPEPIMPQVPEIPVAKPRVPEHLRSITEGLKL